jgi:hypothetical protein
MSSRIKEMLQSSVEVRAGSCAPLISAGGDTGVTLYEALNRLGGALWLIPHYRLPKDAQVRSFEVDAPKTQAAKRELLNKAGIDTRGVTFVSADFETEDWLTRLVESGFDTGKPCLFLWEG